MTYVKGAFYGSKLVDIDGNTIPLIESMVDSKTNRLTFDFSKKAIMICLGSIKYIEIVYRL